MTKIATALNLPLDASVRHLAAGRNNQGLIRSVVLALGVHASLIAGLTWGVGWRQHSPTPTVQAELWAAVPTLQAPAPSPEPAPEPEAVKKPTESPPPAELPTPKEQAPGKPQINIEKAKKPPKVLPEKEKPNNKKKIEQEKKQAAVRAKEESQLAAVRLQIEREKARADALARMNAMAKSTGKTPGRDTQTAAPSQGYLGRISALIKPNITYTGTKAVDVEAQFEVVLSSQGVIQSVTLKKSSGIEAWDQSAFRALIKTERLPLDNGRVYSPLLFAMRPKDF
jgi:colicin import membrane protein